MENSDPSDVNSEGHQVASNPTQYDRMSELRAFDETKAGVKGLVDSGITSIPRIFIANKNDPTFKPDKLNNTHNDDPHSIDKSKNPSLPIIDLHGISNENSRKKVVEEIRQSCEEWGFFQVVNHGIPLEVLDKMIEGVRGFHEQETEEKKQYYSRDRSRKFRYNSSFDLYRSPVANWRDSFGYYMFGPKQPDPKDLPQVCRDVIFEYTNQVKKLGMTLLELLSGGLGLEQGYLKENLNCAEGILLLGNYYPPCPQPELAIGTMSHSDSGFFTILLQDQVGGLQIQHNDKWVDVSPIHGALVINIADLMQLITNDRFKSVNHKVVAKREGPRMSIACFFQAENGEKLYGPIKELLSKEETPTYREITPNEHLAYLLEKGLDGTSALQHFKISKD